MYAMQLPVNMRMGGPMGMQAAGTVGGLTMVPMQAGPIGTRPQQQQQQVFGMHPGGVPQQQQQQQQPGGPGARAPGLLPSPTYPPQDSAAFNNGGGYGGKPARAGSVAAASTGNTGNGYSSGNAAAHAAPAAASQPVNRKVPITCPGCRTGVIPSATGSTITCSFCAAIIDANTGRLIGNSAAPSS
jgi:ribosomal protein S27E